MKVMMMTINRVDYSIDSLAGVSSSFCLELVRDQQAISQISMDSMVGIRYCLLGARRSLAPATTSSKTKRMDSSKQKRKEKKEERKQVAKKKKGKKKGEVEFDFFCVCVSASGKD